MVETARAFIEQNAERLPKAMKPTDAQVYEPGDLVALSFDDPAQEARYIVETCKALPGVAVREGDEQRGISWSDMAILLRAPAGKSQRYAREFGKLGVPLAVARSEFYRSLEISDMLSVLQILTSVVTVWLAWTVALWASRALDGKLNHTKWLDEAGRAVISRVDAMKSADFLSPARS